MAFKHGIETTESEVESIAPQTGSAGFQVIVGVAPINLAEDQEAAVNTPVIAYSKTEAQRRMGYSSDFDSYTICQSISANGDLFNIAPYVMINVLDPKKHKKELSKKTVAVVAKTAHIAEKGIMMSTLSVTDQASTKLEADKDYIASFDSTGEIDITLLSSGKGAAATSINVTATQLDPSKVSESDIVGGYDVATGLETGMELIRQVYPKFGMTPGLLVCPGWSKKPVVAAAMAAKCESLNGVFTCECVVDMYTTTAREYSGLKEKKEAMGVAGKHQILCWPLVKKGDAVYSYSAVWAAMAAYTDMSKNNDVPCKSPSNELLNIDAAVLEDGTEILLDTAQAELVNSYGIVTAINDNGWRSWGNVTAAYPGVTTVKDKWINCRRMMSWYRNHIILTYKSKVDDNANPVLIQAITDSENQYLNSLTPDKIAGGTISYDAENTSLTDGEVAFKTDIAFWGPAQHITDEIRFDPSILTDAMGGV